MNKYSKRALKTTATVGMSLAMVLSGVAAPVSAATQEICTVAKRYSVGDILNSKDFVGVKTIDELKAGLVVEINAMDKAKAFTMGNSTVNAYLGYKASGELTPTAVPTTGITTAKIVAGTEIGYYSTKEVSYQDPTTNTNITVDKNEKLEEVKTIAAADIAARDAAAILTELTAFESATDLLKPITDKEGGSANLDIEYTYTITASTGITTDVNTKPEESALTGVTGVKAFVKIKTAATDYNCLDVEVGLGITIGSLNHANNVYKGIVTSFDKAELSLDTITLGKEVDFTNAGSTTELGEITVLNGTKASTKIDVEFAATLRNLSKVLDSNSDEGKAIERFLGIEKAMNNMFKTGGAFIDADGYDEDTKLNSRTYKTAVDLLKEFTDFDTYLTNLTEEDADLVREKRDLLEELVTGYIAENDGDMIDVYLTHLEKFFDQFVENEGVAGITKADVDAAIKKIKKGGSFTSLKNESITLFETDYLAFKDIDGVVDYVTKFEDMYEEIAAVKEATSKSNDAYKALIKGGSDSVRSFLKGKVEDGKTFDKILDDISIEDYKILKAYKDEVLDVLMTMEAKEVGNTFVNKSTKSIYATTTQLRDALLNISNKEVTADGITTKDGVFTALDREDGLFNWDVLASHMDKVVESHELLTKGIAKLDPITLVASDRATILAADDAVYFLEVGGDGAGNLTSSEARDVRNAQRKVNELLEAYRVKFGSISEISGWENKGNGDWAYYENGNAVTKWVAAGSDWYYVSNGLMLRNSWIAENASGARWYYVNDKGVMVTNTVVDGYKIDANGIWTK